MWRLVIFPHQSPRWWNISVSFGCVEIGSWRQEASDNSKLCGVGVHAPCSFLFGCLWARVCIVFMCAFKHDKILKCQTVCSTFVCEHKLNSQNVFAVMFCLHEGHHTGDQLGADLDQLSLWTNGPSGNCLSSPSPPSPLPPPPSLPRRPPVCLLDFPCLKTILSAFIGLFAGPEIAASGDSFLETDCRGSKCLCIDGVLFHEFHV